jgi:hypothetical protein
MRTHLSSILIALLTLSAAAHAAPPSYGTLPAGTGLNIRTTQGITADASHVGMRVTGVVDDPVTDASGRAVIPRGTPAMLEVVDVQRSSNLKGRDRVTFKALSVHVDGIGHAIATSRVEVKGPSEGKRAARKIGGGAGVGALFGGLVGGGTGAIVGATAGGATGAIVAGSGKTHLIVPAETRLHFSLSAPVRIRR